MSFARRFLYSIGGILLLLVVVGVFLPATTRVERDVMIDAPRATVFALINDVRRSLEWSPWADPETTTRTAFSGPETGVGATLRWRGDASGQGQLTIVESRPFERVGARLSLDGDPASSTFTLQDVAGGTRVLWALEIDFGIDLPGRYGGLVLDNVRERDLERGLASLKTLAESLPRADFSDLEIEAMTVEPVEIAYLTATSPPDAAAVSEAMGDAYFEILGFIDRQGLSEAGAPLSITRTFSGSELVFDAAIPVAGVTPATPRSENGVQLATTYGGPAVRAAHVGSYRDLGETHRKLAAWLAAHGIERNGNAWEVYVSDPTRVPEAELLTYVYYPVKRRAAPDADTD
jgi:effector-binding domain-containing protein/uncharacterized protein YndB with AHSA1/START domain